MIFEVVNMQNQKVGEVDLSDAIFGCDIKPHLIYEVVKMQQARKRRGSASVKNRALVRGGGRKPYRQKGTGRARMGTIRSPLHRGGGIVFGPTPRSYAYSIPKKMRKTALRSALSLKLKEEKFKIVDQLLFDGIKTKHVAQMLKTLNQDDKTLILIEEKNDNLEKSARNIPSVKVLRVEGLNVYDLLKFDHLLLTKPCIERIEGALKVS